jgi:AcrR family transcriptional regulator
MSSPRNPDQTRRALLQAAYNEIRKHGFQAANLDAILGEAGLAKGALYHHFPNKKALGYAVVDEVIMSEIVEKWITPLENAERPLDSLRDGIQRASECLSDEYIRYGCTLNTLAQEMASVDEEFRVRVNRIYSLWRDGIGQALKRGQVLGHVRTDINVESSAAFIVAALEGILGMAKAANSLSILKITAEGLLQYLETLRAPS